MSFFPSNNLMKENSPYPRSSQSKYVMYCKSRIYKLEQYAWKSKTYPSSLLVHWIFYKVWRAFYFGVSTSKWKELREKCPNTELFMVRIFLYSDWIRRFTREKCPNTELFNGPYLSVFRLNTEIYSWKVFKDEVISGPYFPVFGPEITPYLDTFHAVEVFWSNISISVCLTDVYSEPCQTSKIEFCEKYLTAFSNLDFWQGSE